MTTPNPNTPPNVEELQASVSRLTKALEAERIEHKATRTELAALTGGDVEKIVTERLATHKAEADASLAGATKERDAAREEAKAHRERWAGSLRDRALEAALRASNILPDFLPDALAFARDSFEVTDDGEVRTKAGIAGVIAGASADQYTLGQLRALKPSLWPRSQGGGSVGGSRSPSMVGSSTECFRPGPGWNLSQQCAFERKHGTRAAEAAARQYGVTPFGLGR